MLQSNEIPSNEYYNWNLWRALIRHYREQQVANIRVQFILWDKKKIQEFRKWRGWYPWFFTNLNISKRWCATFTLQKYKLILLKLCLYYKWILKIIRVWTKKNLIFNKRQAWKVNNQYRFVVHPIGWEKNRIFNIYETFVIILRAHAIEFSCCLEKFYLFINKIV